MSEFSLVTSLSMKVKSALPLTHCPQGLVVFRDFSFIVSQATQCLALVLAL